MPLRKKDALGPARRMARYINAVILAATASPKERWKHSAVHCRRSPQHRRCYGRLLVCEKDNGDIEYQCPCCSEKGVIRGWQGCFYDLSEMREQSEQLSFEIALTEREYDELTRALSEDIETDCIIYGATYAENGVILRADALDIRYFADCLDYDAKHARNSRHRRTINQVLYRVRELLGKWSPG